MATLKETEEELKAVSIIEMITTTYQEISHVEMEKIRERVLRNRRFIEELLKVYREVKRGYLVEQEERKEEGKEGKKEIIKSKKGKLIIFLSANKKFYGALILKTWKEISDYLKKGKADLAVVGEVGRNLVRRTNPKLKFHYFYLDDEKPKEIEVKKISDFIQKYQETIVFHGKFKTILTQQVAETNISGEIKKGETEEEPVKYLFEPSP